LEGIRKENPYETKKLAGRGKGRRKLQKKNTSEKKNLQEEEIFLNFFAMNFGKNHLRPGEGGVCGIEGGLRSLVIKVRNSRGADHISSRSTRGEEKRTRGGKRRGGK